MGNPKIEVNFPTIFSTEQTYEKYSDRLIELMKEII